MKMYCTTILLVLCSTLVLCEFTALDEPTETIYVTPITNGSEELDYSQDSSHFNKTLEENVALNKRQNRQFVYYSPTMRKKDKNKPKDQGKGRSNNSKTITSVPNSQRRSSNNINRTAPKPVNNQMMSSTNNKAVANPINRQRRFTHLHYNQYNQQKFGPNNVYSYSTIRRPMANNNYYNVNRQQPSQMMSNYQGYYVNNINPYRMPYSLNRRVASSTTRRPFTTTKRKFKAPIVMF